MQCLPHLEHAAAACDPTHKREINNREMVQSQAIRFIAEIKGTKEVTEARAKLELPSLQLRRQHQRLKF